MTKKEEQLEKLEQESHELIRAATAISITSDTKYESAAEFLLVVKQMESQIVDHHEPMRQKTYEAYQEVLSAKKRLLEPVTKAEGIVKRAMAKFMAIRRDKQEAIAEKIRKGEPGKLRKAPTPKGVSTRESWDYEIVNESKISPDYMIPDHTMIRKMVISLGEDAEEIIGGIKVIKTTSIAASRGRM